MEERIVIAKHDNNELNKIIQEYIPFMKKVLSETICLNLEYDDKLSIAMLVFMSCVKQYEKGRGSFLTFVSTCIKNRLIDEGRKNKRKTSNLIPLSQQDESDEINSPLEGKASIEVYNKEEERLNISYEIKEFEEKLKIFGIKFSELEKISPKQDRARNQCIEVARFIVSNDSMKENFLKYNRLPQGELAIAFNISVKTIEKHRKYIVTIVLLFLGDYPLIQAFLPQFREVKR